MMTLQVTWFFIIGVLLIGYAILDGFDLGVGFWHLFSKEDAVRRANLQAIGPFWDGNEVWLLTAGGAIFAAFPPVYATVFSGFYLAMILVLMGLIFRAVAIDFRNHVESPRWQRIWDRAFAVGSMLPSLLFGVALGNVMRGLPLDANGDYTGTFFDLLNPFSLMVGLLGFAMIAAQGAWYLAVKLNGPAGERAQTWGRLAWGVFTVLLVVATLVSIFTQDHLLQNFRATPALWLLPLLLFGVLGASGWWGYTGKPLRAFLAHSTVIALLLVQAGVSIFPNILLATNDPGRSLTLMNASSSQGSLTAMLIIALIGMPLVLGYTIWVYRAFSGKITPGETEGGY